MAEGTCIVDGDSIPCRDNMPHCYARSKVCIYDTVTVDEKRSVDVQSTCRDGVHLRGDCGICTDYL